MSEVVNNENANTPNVQEIFLDGKVITQMELREAQNKPGQRIKLVEGTSNQYKTLQRLQG
jgi:hypothetical protein